MVDVLVDSCLCTVQFTYGMCMVHFAVALLAFQLHCTYLSCFSHHHSLQSFRDKVKSSFQKSVHSVMKKPPEPVVQQISAPAKVMGRSKSWGKADKVEL